MAMNKEFVQGFALAIGALIRDHDEPTLAQNIMVDNGISLDDMRRSEVDAFDLKPIAEKIRE